MHIYELHTQNTLKMGDQDKSSLLLWGNALQYLWIAQMHKTITII